MSKTKVCTKCGEIRPLELFAIRKQYGTRYSWCNKCTYKARRSKIDSDTTVRAHVFKKNREWRREHMPQVVAARRDWVKQNPEKERAIRANQRAKRANAIGEAAVTAGYLQFLLESQKGKCPSCRKELTKYHVDHILPIALGGKHERGNIQLLCAPCNHRKYAKHPVEHMQSRGYLL